MAAKGCLARRVAAFLAGTALAIGPLSGAANANGNQRRAGASLGTPVVRTAFLLVQVLSLGLCPGGLLNSVVDSQVFHTCCGNCPPCQLGISRGQPLRDRRRAPRLARIPGVTPRNPSAAGGVRWLWDPPSGASGEQGGQANGRRAESDCHARAPGGSPKP